MPLFIRPMAYFLYRYLARLGFLDGSAGLIYHLFHALWYRMLIDVKIAQFRAALKSGACTVDELALEYAPSVARVDSGPTDD